MLKIPLGRDKLHRNIDHDLYSKMSINRSCLVSLLIRKAKKERKARELATLRVKTDRVCFAARVNNYSLKIVHLRTLLTKVSFCHSFCANFFNIQFLFHSILSPVASWMQIFMYIYENFSVFVEDFFIPYIFR